KLSPEDRMSSMGRLAARVRKQLRKSGVAGVSTRSAIDDCVNTPDDCEDGFSEGPAGGQAETSVAVDSTGQHIVVGFNDTRGFALNPTSVSGFMYSDDGGATFAVNGLLPITVPQTSIGATKFPQAFGDPEVKYLGGSSFAYIEIVFTTMLNPGGTRVSVQTLGFHLSTDYGHTWTGPFEIPTATNPNHLFNTSGNPR